MRTPLPLAGGGGLLHSVFTSYCEVYVCSVGMIAHGGGTISQHSAPCVVLGHSSRDILWHCETSMIWSLWANIFGCNEEVAVLFTGIKLGSRKFTFIGRGLPQRVTLL